MSTLKVDTIDTSNSSGNITVSRPLSGSGASLTSLPAANLTGTIAAISGANLTNNSITVDVKLVSSADDNIHIGKNLPIPSGSALNALTGKVVMETGDILRVQSDTANSADIALSVMEVT